MNTADGTLVMAIDCFKTEHSLKNAINSAVKIADSAGWLPKVISVMSPDQIEWPDDFTSDWSEVFQKVGKAALNKFLKKNKIAVPELESKVLFQLYKSRKGSIQTVIAEIQNTKASAVAVFTHIRSRAAKLPAGFVSSIVSLAGVPVFVINAKTPAIKKINKTVFATDFSETDQKSFEQALKFVAQVNSKITIVHILPNLANEMMAAYAGIAGGWNNYGPYLEMQYEKAEADGKKWKEKAEANGVEAEFEMVSHSRSIPAAILRSAKKHRADLIVMTEKTGPWAATILGSVTRQILEASPLPVLVIPARARSKSGAVTL